MSQSGPSAIVRIEDGQLRHSRALIAEVLEWLANVF